MHLITQYKNRLAVIIAIFFFNFSLNAKKIYVNDGDLTGDVYCSAIGNNSNTGLSPSQPYLTLTKAIGVAADNDSILVDAGTYKNESISVKKKGLIIIGAGKDNTIFLSTFNFTGPLFYDLGGYSTCSGNCNVTEFTLQHVKIKNYIEAGAITIGASNTIDTTRINISSCVFDGNYTASPNSVGGGAICVRKDPTASLSKPAVVTLTSCDFLNNNTNFTLSGGSLFAKDGCRLIVTSCNFNYCLARSILYYPSGGGFIATYKAGLCVISNCVFRGGYLGYPGTLLYRGGALSFDQTSFSVSNSYFHENGARGGSAITFEGGGNALIENSLFFENINDSYEGVIYVSGGTMNINNCTIANNSSDYSSGNAGVYRSSGTVNLNNSIVWGNEFKDVSLGVTIQNSIVDAAGGGNTTGASTSDPLLTNVASKDFTLSVGSPAIDFGTSSVLTTDIIGFTRTAVPDAGAFEFGSTPITIPLCGVFVVPPPAPTVSVTVQPTCLVPIGTVVVSSPAEGTGYEYSIDGGTYQSSATFTGVSPGSHSVKVRKTADITQVSDATSVTVNAAPTIPTAGITNNTGVAIINCTNTSISLTATGGGTYSWSDGTSTVSSVADLIISDAGTYIVTVTGSNGCTDTETITITKDITVPTAGITNNTGVTQIDCINTSISLTATGGGSYSWSDGTSTVSSVAGLSVSDAGTYTVTVTAANGCTDTEVITITKVASPPIAGITNNTGVTQIDCTNPTISLTATGGGTYSWSDGTSTVSVVDALSVSNAGTYTVTVIAANGCTDTESITITKDITTPIASITNNTGTTEVNCINTSIGLTATGGGTYSWSDGTSTVGSVAGLSVTDAGNYTVMVTGSNGCTDTETISITKDITVPTAGITNNTGVTQIDCINTSISLTATGGGTYSWSDGTSTLSSVADLTVSDAGTYTVTVTSANGCTDTELITITKVASPPTAGITNNTGVTQIDCTNPSISLTATGGGTYSWSDGTSTVSVVAALSVSNAGTYTLTVTAANGCTDTESITITKDITTPTAGITNNTGSTEVNCTNTSISLTATGGGTYSWSDGTSTVSSVAGLSVTDAGIYTVTVTGSNGCTDTETITITKDITVPMAGITNNTGVTQIDCINTSISLTATGGGTYSWSDGTSIVSSVAGLSVSDAGSYTVTVTAANGCTDTEVITITKVASPPTAGITNNTGVTQIDCTNPTISLTATGGGTYSWSDGTSTVSVVDALSVSNAGTYTVTVTAANGCTDTEVITITKDITTPTAGITNNTGSTEVNCTNTSISLTATGGGTYSWSDGTSTVSLVADLTVSNAGIYTITVTGLNGCTDTEIITITKDIIVPTAGITNNTGVTQIDCINTSISLTATGGGTYSWSDGTSIVSSVAGLIVSDAGIYTVTVKGVNGCTATKNITTTKFTNPSPPSKITSSDPIEFCEGKDVLLTAISSQVGTYEWKKSGVIVGNLPTLTVSQSGVYEVTITVAGCKSVSNDTTVVVNPAPAKPSLSNPAIFCSSENPTIADLTLKMNVLNLKWFDEALNELPTTTKLLHQGKYYAQQISALGCGSLSNELVQVTINDNPGTPAGSDSLFYCKNNNAKVSDLIPQSSLGTTIEWSYLNVKQDINNPLTEGKYKAVAIKEGCTSAGSHEVYVKIDDPIAPVAPTVILCANNQTALMLYDLYPNDNTKLFYATSSSNVALSNKTISKGETYYVKNKSKLGCLSESTQLIVNASSGPPISSNPYILSPALCLIDKPTLDDVESKYNALPSSSGSMNWYLGQNDKLTDFVGKDIPIGSGDYWIALKDNNGCYSVKQKVTITVDAGVKPILKPIELCASKTYTVNELNISNLANPQGILSWYDTKNSPALSNSDNVDQSKEYWARYKKDPTACESSDSLKLIVTWIKFDNQVDLDNKNQVFCKSNITLIDNLNVEPYVKGTIGWFESLTSNDLLLNTDLLIEKDYFASEYKVISDGSNCVNSNRDKIQVTFYTTKLYPQVTASVCNKQNGVIQFDNVPTDYVLTWYNMSDTTKVDFVGNKYSKPLEQQSFKIMFTDKNNCLDSVYISMPACSVSEVPQIITPDNDGNNDTWDIGFATKYPKVQVFIFNRWGNEVYKSAIPYDDSWDGKYNNEYLPTGTYYYVIDKGNGDPKETGFVELVK